MWARNGERHLLAKRFPLELHMIIRIGGIRKFTFDVSNKNGIAHREFGRNQIEFVRLQSLRKMTGKGIGKRGRLALIFYLRVIIGDVQPRALFQEEGIAHSLVRTFAVDARSIVTAD